MFTYMLCIICVHSLELIQFESFKKIKFNEAQLSRVAIFEKDRQVLACEGLNLNKRTIVT